MSDVKDLTDRIVNYSNRISQLLMEKADLVQENGRLRAVLEGLKSPLWPENFNTRDEARKRLAEINLAVSQALKGGERGGEAPEPIPEAYYRQWQNAK